MNKVLYRMILGIAGIAALVNGVMLAYIILEDAAREGPMLLFLYVVSLAVLAYGFGMIVERLIQKINSINLKQLGF